MSNFHTKQSTKIGLPVFWRKTYFLCRCPFNSPTVDVPPVAGELRLALRAKQTGAAEELERVHRTVGLMCDMGIYIPKNRPSPCMVIFCAFGSFLPSPTFIRVYDSKGVLLRFEVIYKIMILVTDEIIRKTIISSLFHFPIISNSQLNLQFKYIYSWWATRLPGRCVTNSQYWQDRSFSLCLVA